MRDCLVCGSDIINRRADAKYCSKLCCRRAYNRASYKRDPQKAKEAKLKWVSNNRARYLKIRQTREKEARKIKRALTGKLPMRSGFERTLATQLKREGTIFTYETLTLPFVMHHKYRPDFMLENGIVIEAKGVLNKHKKDEASKLIAVKQQHPDIDLRLVFMDANVKIPGTKQTHGQWATRHGFQWASGSIPKEWLIEP